jgi:hypothetical protein
MAGLLANDDTVSSLCSAAYQAFEQRKSHRTQAMLQAAQADLAGRGAIGKCGVITSRAAIYRKKGRSFDRPLK